PLIRVCACAKLDLTGAHKAATVRPSTSTPFLLSLIAQLLPASAGQNNKLPQDPGGKGNHSETQQTEQFEFANRHESSLCRALRAKLRCASDTTTVCPKSRKVVLSSTGFFTNSQLAINCVLAARRILKPYWRGWRE